MSPEPRAADAAHGLLYSDYADAHPRGDQPVRPRPGAEEGGRGRRPTQGCAPDGAGHVIAEFEAAKSMPWDEAARASARVLVSNLTRWLPEPEEEHETLRAAFGAARSRHMGTAYLP